MAELLKSKRVFFPSNKQQEFLLQSQRHLHCTWKHLALLSKISTHHLINWRNEKNSMSLFAVKQICKHRNIEVPKCIVIKDAYWYVTESARAGGKAVIEKYGIVGGDQEHRKKKWQEWWEKEGKFKPSDILKPLPFRKPVFSKNLAEFAGIMLGDGGMSKHQFTVTLNSITDKKYSKFVHRLIKNLFEIPVGVYFNKKFLAKRIVVSRTAIISYLIGTVGLQPGNKVKQQVDIPFWIKENQQHSIACLRGLIDTDGCIILHRYLSKGKTYSYKKVSFTSRSYPLLVSVSKILLNLGIKHRIMRNKWDIRIEARKDVEKYFQVVGTHNPKHLKRYKMA